MRATVSGKEALQPVRLLLGGAAQPDVASAIQVFAARPSGGEALVAGTFTVKALDGDEAAVVDVRATIVLP